eukprot:NODE_1285_length_1602_cov_25.422408_g1150_i0.p1 GENE.NODE_1285_length_1602_cov_25.422408_g1150_i0~~NODE_1285_length_1602_cov_25.422408_g1150_i0.p1  ORF type:complete len:353 (-),score=52.50 NODE_1285_length_1602_cov_25.422408_g1150_i0:423-1481(-)
MSGTVEPRPLEAKEGRKRIVITGGCGFIGHHVVAHFVQNLPDYEIIVLDKLTYASQGLDRLRAIGVEHRVKLFAVDLALPLTSGLRREIGRNVEFVVHLAAETHVDNSISNPVPFVMNNVASTLTMLEFARSLPKLRMFIYFSTDEVYGPALGSTAFREDDRHRPANPYAASKSASEQICLSYSNTFQVPVFIVNVMNAFGERQHPEKFIPKVIQKVLAGETVYIHSYPDRSQAGTRFYIHARSIAAAILFLLERGRPGETYHLLGDREVDNLQLAQMIAGYVGRPLKYEMVDFHSTRPGHDLRYGLDGSKMERLGWKLPRLFEASLAETVRWTLEHPEWLEADQWSADAKL